MQQDREREIAGEEKIRAKNAFYKEKAEKEEKSRNSQMRFSQRKARLLARGKGQKKTVSQRKKVLRN